MKLANKAYIVTLLMLTFVFTATAQKNLRPASDPRNTSPTVGTGGAVGGPTGLFTVYDGETLRKGEYTFSAAFSNYDRDPGDVDFSSLPLSFQIGVTDYVELFFETEAMRGVKVNARRNLSSNYLPNSQLFVSGFGVTSPPAIVMAPRGPGNPLIQGAVFRPTGNQPFTPYPYIGGSAGTYGLLPGFFSGPQFGYPAGTNALLSVTAGGNGASNFPGIGSVYGGILPGLVLATTPLLNQAGAPAGQAPTSFTLAASYNPDAPFINRGYGESAFNSFTVGGKWRWTNVNNPISAGVVAYYRWYADNASDAAGFNQLQRGASPGGNIGDIGVTMFGGARLAKWANLSANVGFMYASDVKGDMAGGTFTLLDRGNELTGSIGVDFPVNKYFQPIVEFRSLSYVGGRTPNAFENNPMDAIFGAKIHVTRYAGFGAAYRYHVNQQDRGSFNNDVTYTNTVAIPCRAGQTVGCPQTVTSSFRGVPQGFQVSSDPHGFIFQGWIGRRNKRAEAVVNQVANVNSVTLSNSTITIGCPPGFRSRSGACNDNRTIGVATSASDPENDVLTYNYTVSGGRIVGSGANVDWDLSGAQPGTYTITTAVNDGCGVCGKTDTRTVTIKACDDCVKICDCPTLSVDGPSGVTNPGSPMSFTANVSGGADVTYNWTVSEGTISSGQGTSAITVDTTGLAGRTVTATVNIGGLDPNCNCVTSDSESAPVAAKPDAELVDEFQKQVDDEVKARVDNFYIRLNNDPNAQGYIINYGTAAEIKKRRAQIMKAINFRKYDVSRVTFVDSISDGGVNTKFYLVPSGADNPMP